MPTASYAQAMRTGPIFTAALLICLTPSCTTIDGESLTSANVTQGVPGGEFSETTRIKATVTQVDQSKRKLTFVTPKGKKFTSTVGEEVDNFDQIKVGDQLLAVLTNEVSIRIAKPGEKLSESSTLDAELAPRESKPGIKTVESSQIVAVVSKISTRKRRVTLALSDGKTKRVRVRSDIDLSKFKIGDRVVIRVVETVAIGLTKP